MKKLLISVSALVLTASMAHAGSTLAIGGGAATSNTLTGAATTSHGLGGRLPEPVLLTLR